MSVFGRTRKRALRVRALTLMALLTAGLLGLASPASAADPGVWVGSPMSATWPDASGCAGAVYPSSSCSLPSVHWWLARAPQGDWSADLQSAAPGTPVVLYAAPQDGVTPVTAVIDAVGPACSSGRVADGGYLVTVAFYTGGTRVGSATYAHINPTVTAGSTVSRWGTQLGTIGTGYDTRAGCWGGPHVHFQMYSTHNYACYNRGWAPGQSMNPTNFLGFVGGSWAASPRQPCP